MVLPDPYLWFENCFQYALNILFYSNLNGL